MGTIELGAYALAGYKLFWEAHLAGGLGRHFIPHPALNNTCVAVDSHQEAHVHVCPECAIQGTCVLFADDPSGAGGLLCISCLAKWGIRKSRNPQQRVTMSLASRLARDTHIAQTQAEGGISRFFVQPPLSDLKEHVKKAIVPPGIDTNATRSAMSLAYQQVSSIRTIQIESEEPDLCTTMMHPENIKLTTLATSLFSGTHGPQLHGLMSKGVRRVLVLAGDLTALSCLIEGEETIDGKWQYPSAGLSMPASKTQDGKEMLADFRQIQKLSAVERGGIAWRRIDRMRASPQSIARVEREVNEAMVEREVNEARGGVPTDRAIQSGRPSAGAPMALSAAQKDRKQRFIEAARRLTLKKNGGRFWLPQTPDGVPFFLCGEGPTYQARALELS